MCRENIVLLQAHSRRGRDWIEKHVDYQTEMDGQFVLSFSDFDEVKTAAQKDDLAIRIIERM